MEVERESGKDLRSGEDEFKRYFEKESPKLGEEMDVLGTEIRVW